MSKRRGMTSLRIAEAGSDGDHWTTNRVGQRVMIEVRVEGDNERHPCIENMIEEAIRATVSQNHTSLPVLGEGNRIRAARNVEVDVMEVRRPMTLEMDGKRKTNVRRKNEEEVVGQEGVTVVEMNVQTEE